MPKFVLDVQSEEEKEKLLLLAIDIIRNLRKFTKIWEEKYGETRVPKKRWEKFADDFISKLTITEIPDDEGDNDKQNIS